MEDFVGKSIIVFDENGNGIYSIDWPFDQSHLDHLTEIGAYFAILSKELPHLYWMDLASKDQDVMLRTSCPDITSNKSKVKADGADTVTIAGLPTPCILNINGVVTHADDDEFELTSQVSQTVSITLGGPHRSNAIVVEFVDLAECRAIKWAELKTEREKRLLTAETSFGVFDTNTESKTTINAILSNLMISKSLNLPSEPVRYRMHDDTFKNLTPDEFMQASLEIGVYLENVLKRSWALKDYLDRLTQIDAIEELQWSADLS